MKKVVTNLGKRLHMYKDLKDANRQLNHDVVVLGEQLDDFVYQFDPKNPYDQEVLAVILTNILAWIQIHADLDSFDMEPIFKEKYKFALKNYRELYAKKL